MNEVEQIKERLDVAEVISGYIPLKQAGRNLKAPCPFHHEKTASFMVSPDKGIWHCFGCHEGGDVIAFVMKYEGLEFPQALEKLARQAGIELKPRGAGDSRAKKESARLREAEALAVKYFQASLIKNKTALDYAVKKRGLNKQTIVDFMIGYAPDDWNALSHFLVKKNFSASELKKAGLVGQKEGRSSIYDLYRGRLMFTICDGDGRPVGFTGRVLDDDQVPKYLNTPATPLYDKSRVIFGLHLARPAIREHDEAVLVEGNMDAVMSHQAGIKQVVAVSGTALTADQLRALGRLTKNIKLCFDADAAGLRATERAIELSQNLGLNLSVIALPEGKDPDDLVKKDPDSWKNAIKAAKYAVDYLFDQLANQYDLATVSGKRQYSDRLAANIRRLADSVERDHYTKLLAKKLEVGEDSIKEKLEEPEPAREPAPAATKTEITPRNPKFSLEQAVLGVNLAFKEVRLSLEDLTPAYFGETNHQQIFEVLQRGGDATKALPNLADYVKILTLRGEEEFGSFAPADRSFEAFELVRRLQKSSNKDTKTKLSKKLREAEASGDQQLARSLLAQYQALITEDE
jgi:DNA primase